MRHLLPFRHPAAGRGTQPAYIRSWGEAGSPGEDQQSGRIRGANSHEDLQAEWVTQIGVRWGGKKSSSKGCVCILCTGDIK